MKSKRDRCHNYTMRNNICHNSLLKINSLFKEEIIYFLFSKSNLKWESFYINIIKQIKIANNIHKL